MEVVNVKLGVHIKKWMQTGALDDIVLPQRPRERRVLRGIRRANSGGPRKLPSDSEYFNGAADHRRLVPSKRLRPPRREKAQTLSGARKTTVQDTRRGSPAVRLLWSLLRRVHAADLGNGAGRRFLAPERFGHGTTANESSEAESRIGQCL